jgi:hypothetical protein
MHNEHEKYHILLQPPRYYTKFYKAAKNLKKNWIMKCISLSPAQRQHRRVQIYLHSLGFFLFAALLLQKFFFALFQE